MEKHCTRRSANRRKLVIIGRRKTNSPETRPENMVLSGVRGRATQSLVLGEGKREQSPSRDKESRVFRGQVLGSSSSKLARIEA